MPPNPDCVVILLSALAVVAAAVCLVAWFAVGTGFALIYASIALAVASLALLWAARWWGSPRTPTEPAPTVDDLQVDDLQADEPVPADRPGRARDRERTSFPIDDYDHLWVTQILPLLGGLDDDELSVVETRERSGRDRGGILDGIAAERHHRSTTPTSASDRWAFLEPDETVDPDPHVEAQVEGDVEAEVHDDVEVEGEHDGGRSEPVLVGGPEHPGPNVRTFLGRRAAPLTIRRG